MVGEERYLPEVRHARAPPDRRRDQAVAAAGVDEEARPDGEPAGASGQRDRDPVLIELRRLGRGRLQHLRPRRPRVLEEDRVELRALDLVAVVRQ